MKIADGKISLTRFIDFVIKTGSPKLTSVKTTKQQLIEGYSPAFDYYKKFREEVVEMHVHDEPVSRLESLAASIVNNDGKQANYSLLAKGYRRFYGPSRQFKWFEPPSSDWDIGMMTVRVNPELGLRIGDDDVVIKLHLKDEKLSKKELVTVLHLMRTALEYEPISNRVYAILDVRRGKLFRESSYDPVYTTLLRGEASSFATIFDGI